MTTDDEPQRHSTNRQQAHDDRQQAQYQQERDDRQHQHDDRQHQHEHDQQDQQDQHERRQQDRQDKHDRRQQEAQDKSDQQDQRYALVVNEPVEVMNPRRKARVIAIVNAMVIVIMAALSAYISASITSYRTETEVAKLMADINRRTAERKKNEGASLRILEQNRRTLCSLMADHDQTPEVKVLVKLYQCNASDEPILPPDWKPTGPPIVPR